MIWFVIDIGLIFNDVIAMIVDIWLVIILVVESIIIVVCDY